jgi:hypothetical protein
MSPSIMMSVVCVNIKVLVNGGQDTCLAENLRTGHHIMSKALHAWCSSLFTWLSSEVTILTFICKDKKQQQIINNSERRSMSWQAVLHVIVMKGWRYTPLPPLCLLRSSRTRHQETTRSAGTTSCPPQDRGYSVQVLHCQGLNVSWKESQVTKNEKLETAEARFWICWYFSSICQTQLVFECFDSGVLVKSWAVAQNSLKNV